VNVSYTTTGGSQVLATATATMPTDFMGIMGYKNLNLSVSSTVAWGNSRLRVALALDNTGSMSSAGKMTALKTATKNLLTQLQGAAAKNGDVYVSIIPFSKDVNVDSVNYQANWIRWDLWENVNGSCSDNDYKTKTRCLNHNKVWTAHNHNTWNGCVTDRDQDYDTKNTPPNTNQTGTLFPAEEYSSCPESMMGLSYDWTALRQKVDAMTPTGNTNQGIGLQWAFQSLTSAPFSIPAFDPLYKYNQIIILLTDGLNTQNRWSTSQSAIDARQAITCDNVKAAGITIYTVQVNTDGDPTQQHLKNCASSSDKFFLLTSANQIVSTFNQIGTAISNLRVAK
jgi:Mg-chelatase subunit ChlD